ncbi:Glutamate receptor ionotropic, delta-1-like 29 [Homarus americanus]|uniref:Glutamate receptor ionotropic, delta-1-like 29 n=2 Tax=Homarus americanus TaxID=6706 RepID=A0A8J5N400_HOMAM|nr:Glutamate receptor ionotropic, delta-1-like 29 [Homarus americanus]
MLGHVWRGEKDLTINYLTITEERNKYFDFSFPYHNEGYGYSIAIPPPLPRWRSLVYSFTALVWAVMGGVLVLVALVFCALTHLHNPLSFSQCFSSILQSLMNQGMSQVPQEWSLRMFLGGWWITAYVLVISYTCNLIAVLTVPVYPTRITTIQQLAHTYYRSCMLDYGEFVPEALATSTHPALSALGAKLDLMPVDGTREFGGQEGCVGLVLEGTHAHVESFSFLKLLYFLLGHKDVVYFVKEQIYQANLAFFFRRNTPWKYKFDQGIQSLVESGLVHKWYDDIMSDIKKITTTSEEDSGPSEQPLSLGHLQGPFLLHLVGLLSSLTVFLVEYCTFNQAGASTQ